MKLSVIIPCYNAADTIAVQLDALAHQQWEEPWEVLVVDNRSTDNSMEIVESYQDRLPHLRIVKASEKQGQPFALNTGIRAASGEAVILCDADDEVGPDYVAVMGNALKNSDFVAASFDTQKLNPFWSMLSVGNNQKNGLQKLAYPPYLPHAGGGTIGMKKSVFEKVGEFADEFPCLHDTDYCLRTQLAGYKICFVESATMYVRMKDNFKDLYRQKRAWARYRVLLAKKYRPGISFSEKLKLIYNYLNGWLACFGLYKNNNSKEDKFKIICHMAWLVGTAEGCLKYRTLPV